MIFTFYSFKGGVGRSMTLANVAALLARWNQRVLIVDWDLEAPGIEQYFKKWLTGSARDKDGVVDIVAGFAKGEVRDWRNGTLQVNPPRSKAIDIITAGRDDGKYSDTLRSLDWEALFERRFGNYLEELRGEWKREYDFVLIDSRTGVTDIGSICTIHLPDVLVAMFTANGQSVDGVRKTLQSARRGHGGMGVDRRRLLVVPVPSRDESGSEYKLAEEWRKRFAGDLGEFFDDWIPKDEQAVSVLNYLKIPYFPFWSFGERIPVLEESDPENPKTLAYAYQPLAKLMLNRLNWKEAREGAKASEEAQKQAVEAERLRLEANVVAQKAKEKDAERRVAETAKREEEFKVRVAEYLRERLEWQGTKLRRTAHWNKRISVALLATVAGVFGFMVFVVDFANSLSDLTQNMTQFSPVWGIGALAILGWVIFRPERRRREAEQKAEALDRERALFMAGTRPYVKLTPEEAFAMLSDRIESILQGRTALDYEKQGSDSAGTLDSRVLQKSERDEPAAPSGLVRENETLRAAVSPSIASVGRTQPALSDYIYDVFISYHSNDLITAWATNEFLPLFSYWLSEQLARDAQVFLDRTRVNPGEDWAPTLERALTGSRCLVPLWTPLYFRSQNCMRELRTFMRHRPDAIVPLALHGMDAFPDDVRRIQWADFRGFTLIGDGFKQTEQYVEFQRRVQELAERVARLIGDVPPFQKDFQVLRLGDVELYEVQAPLK
jgi:MinD-like ATPase involved in chromosome partitioning or flagellar assembly